MRKRILFVINTMGRGGSEPALLALLRLLDLTRYDVSLYVMLGQGELAARLPEGVRLLNPDYDPSDVLSARGKRRLYRRTARLLLHSGKLLRCVWHVLRRSGKMRRAKRRWPDAYLWRCIAESTPPMTEQYDLAVAFMEGASTVYVAERVNAKQKAAFVHVDLDRVGFAPHDDRDVYRAFCRVFCVSSETRDAFLRVHPECAAQTEVFQNILEPESIRIRSMERGGFSDGFSGFRILTVGRLVPQKALELSIRAMSIILQDAPYARWYVLGEGEERKNLSALITELGLEHRFVLLGVKDNPFPYYRQADLYVHCSRFEGKSIAVREAMLLGCPVVLSDCGGNREQVKNGVDGLLVPLEPEAIAAAVLRLIHSASLRRRLGENAALRDQSGGDISALLRLMEDAP